MQCLQCQAENRPGRRFCAGCGTALALACPACQFVNEAGERFCGGCGAVTAAAIAPAAPATPPREHAERRQLTVMFCDLVGSTALSQGLDPEDLRELTRNYREACTGAIARYDGLVAQLLGDGVLAYFGFPTAHEDNAERAVRAGLAIVQAVGALQNQGRTLQVRLGIATGPVVVGTIVGAGASTEQSAVGDTPNLAARLQGLAEPDWIVICPATRALVGGAFEHADLGLHSLKGIAAPVRALRVLGQAQRESRFGGRAAALTPFVGREAEFEQMLQAWTQASAGAGQVLLLSGEAGIGKSRIVETLVERTAEQPRTLLRYQCSPYHTNSTLYPIVAQLEHLLRFKSDEAPAARLVRLEALLGEGNEGVAAVAPLFASLLSIPAEGRYAKLELTPEQQKERTLSALLEQVAGLSRRAPVLFIFEDAHWIDPTTLELLSRSIERLPTLSVLMLVTFRPEFTPPWRRHAHVGALRFERLGASQSTALVLKVTGGKALPPAVLAQIVAKTDGVPLFVEELTKTVLESGLLSEGTNGYHLSGPLPPLAIPASLQDSLMARLDRLAPVKEVAQIGACIGREFAHELLAAVSPLSADELQAALDQLVQSDLIFRRGSGAEISYVFKHALVQDTAYASLLRSRRQTLHAAVATALEAHFHGLTETQPEQLARHYTEAALAPQAIGYWLKAGQRAAERSANVEALSHLGKGLELLAAQPPATQRDRQELVFRSALVGPLMAVKGYTTAEIENNFKRGIALCEALGETRSAFPLLFGQITFHFTTGLIARSVELAEQFLQRAQREPDPGLGVVAIQTRSYSRLVAGASAAAIDDARQAIACYEPERDRNVAVVYGHDMRLSAQCCLALGLWHRGHAAQALQVADAAIAAAEVLGHPHSYGFVLFHGGLLLNLLCRRATALDALAARPMPFAQEQGLRHYRGMTRFFEGWAQVAQTRSEAGIAPMQKLLSRLLATNARNWLPLLYSQLAQAHGWLGDADEGLRLIEQAHASMAGGERFAQADVHRVQAELLLAKALPREAEAALRRALEGARAQGARAFELRAATGLAGLWASQGQRAQALDLLAPVYASFSEGFDLPDLQEAQATLAALA